MVESGQTAPCDIEELRLLLCRLAIHLPNWCKRNPTYYIHPLAAVPLHVCHLLSAIRRNKLTKVSESIIIEIDASTP